MTKKIYPFVIILLTVTSSSFAQWAGSTTTANPIYRDGNVGIGTTTPQAPLNVVTTGDEIAVFKNTTATNSRIVVVNTVGQVNLGIGAANPHPYVWSATNKFYIGDDGPSPTFFVKGMNAGFVGIGTTDPWTPLTVVSNNNFVAHFQSTGSNNSAISVSNAIGQVNLGIGAATPHPYIWSNTNNLFIGSDGAPTVFINGMTGGNVGIGTTTPQAKLAVNGDIFAKKIKVTLAGWPDYVFDNKYKLPSLTDIEKFIKQYKHLPNVPSAEEVKKDRRANLICY